MELKFIELPLLENESMFINVNMIIYLQTIKKDPQKTIIALQGAEPQTIVMPLKQILDKIDNVGGEILY